MKCFTLTLVSALLLSFVALTLATEDSEQPTSEAPVEPETETEAKGPTVTVQLDEHGYIDIEL